MSGIRIAGIVGDSSVEIVATRPYAPDVVEVTPKGRDGQNSGLENALEDLEHAVTEALEEELPRPPGTALKNARRLLEAMYGIFPQRFEVYPTRDGEIAIHAPGGTGRSVIPLCGSDGDALCLVNMRGAPRRARYSNVERRRMDSTGPAGFAQFDPLAVPGTETGAGEPPQTPLLGAPFTTILKIGLRIAGKDPGRPIGCGLVGISGSTRTPRTTPDLAYG